MARPNKEIDQRTFEKLCGIQCTKAEICAFLDVTDKTLDRWCKRTYAAGFSEIYAQKRQAGHISLRRAQWHLAEKSAAMAIFLGQNYLGQRNNYQFEDREALSRLDAILDKMKDAANAKTE